MKKGEKKVGPIQMSKADLEDKWLICPKCKKTIGQLLARDMVITSRKAGARCADCNCNFVRGRPARKLSEKARKKLWAKLGEAITALERELGQ